MICDEDPLRRRPRESTARRKRQERCVWMARKMTEWPSKRGPITKIMPSDGCIGDTVPLAVGKWYEFHEFGWYMGNVGSTESGSLIIQAPLYHDTCHHMQLVGLCGCSLRSRWQRSCRGASRRAGDPSGAVERYDGQCSHHTDRRADAESDGHCCGSCHRLLSWETGAIAQLWSHFNAERLGRGYSTMEDGIRSGLRS